MNQITNIGQKRRIIYRLEVVERLDAVLGGKTYESIKRPQLVEILKASLQDGKAEVQRRFEAGGKGGDVVRG
ncbi:MAG: hypothetical protein HON14_17840, partial [Rhodospirillaceae bacterium]|nr:hypothetical protein [Rhodospirillaceae bacterium]